MTINESTFSVPEPDGDLAAQIDSLFDPSSTRHTVWLDDPDVKNLVTRDLGDGLIWAAIPGKGHVVTTNGAALQDIVLSGASQDMIAKALGYSQTKPEISDSTAPVLQVVNPGTGEVAWEQGYTPGGYAEHRAVDAARRQLTEGSGQMLRAVPVMEALKRRLDLEEGE